MHDVAGIHQTQSDSTGDRRADVAICELHFRNVHLAMVEFYRAFVLMNIRGLGVELLLRDRVFGESFLVTFEIEPGVFKEGGITSQLSLGLSERRLKRRGVNFHQCIALVNQLPFLVVHFHELAIHAALHRYCIERRHHAQRADVHSDIALLCLRGPNHESGWSGARFATSALLFGVSSLQKDAGSNSEKNQRQQNPRPSPQVFLNGLIFRGIRSVRAFIGGGRAGRLVWHLQSFFSAMLRR